MLEAKISRLPMGDDIAKLLLLCAPPNALKELDLSDENEGEFADHFNSLSDYFKHEMIALALYYANRNTVNFIKSNSIIRLLYISPEVVHSLVQLADIESFSETEGLLIEVAKDKKSKAGKTANSSRVNNFNKIKDELKLYWQSHITSTLKAPAAARLLERSEIYQASSTKPTHAVLARYVREWQK